MAGISANSSKTKIPGKGKIDPIKAKELEGLLIKTDKRFRRIKEQLSTDAGRDGVSYEALKYLARTTFVMIPIALATYKQFKNERGAYAYSTLVNQYRELQHDLRALGDKTEVIDRIMSLVIEPNLSTTVQHTSNLIDKAQRKMVGRIQDPAARKFIQGVMKAVLKAQVEFLTSLHESYRAQIEIQIKK